MGVGKEDEGSSPQPGRASRWGSALGTGRCSSSFAVPELHKQLTSQLQMAGTLAPQLASRLHGRFLGAVREGRLGGSARGLGFCRPSQEPGAGSPGWRHSQPW